MKAEKIYKINKKILLSLFFEIGFYLFMQKLDATHITQLSIPVILTGFANFFIDSSILLASFVMKINNLRLNCLIWRGLILFL